MYNPQFLEERNSNVNIKQRLSMEIHDFYHGGAPQEWDNLVQLLIDARNYILYIQKKYNLDENEVVPVKE